MRVLHIFKNMPLCAALCLWSVFLSIGAARAENASATDIMSASSGQCATVSGGSVTQGAAIVQSPCVGAASQRWSLSAVGNYFHVVSNGSGMCLNVSGGSKAENAAIIADRKD